VMMLEKTLDRYGALGLVGMVKVKRADMDG
jgi:hypothetical protein